MPIISRGFRGRRAPVDPDRVPPGQYVTHGFPVLTYGPTPRVKTGEWSLSVDGEVDTPTSWRWEDFLALP